MDYRYLDQDEITQLIKERFNISITKGTFTRYNQLGFILMPQKLTGVSGNNRRVGYHPFVPAELATAFLLFKGDWLESDSNFRIGRATVQDVFLGRLLFYQRSVLTNLPSSLSAYTNEIDSFNTSIRSFFPDTDSFPDMISMTPDSVKYCLDFYMTQVLKPFLDSGIRDSYLNYIEDTYRITFLHMIDTILLPDHKPKPMKRIIPPTLFLKTLALINNSAFLTNSSEEGV